jgi:hypothetical protein
MRPPRAYRRQDPRFFVDLPATVISTRPHRDVVTWDLSFRGLFFRTRSPVPLRRLVRFAIVSPGTGLEMVLHGMVVNVIGPDDPEGRPQGMGVELYALDADARSAWWDLVRYVRDNRDDQPSGVHLRPDARR